MLDVFEFCQSTRFLAGGATQREKQFEFSPKRPWIRRVTDVGDYLDAVTRDPDREVQETPWHVLEERYLDELRGIAGKIKTNGRGSVVEEARKRRSEFSEYFGSVKKTRALADEIGRVTMVDGDRLFRESLMEMPYGHLDTIMMMQTLLPHVEFPLITVMVDAYQEGLLPYGVFNGRLDRTYAGPDVLLCIDPVNLELKG